MVLAVLLLAAAGAASLADEPSGPVGAWRINGTDDRGQARAAVLYITEGEDGGLAGRWNTRAGSVELHDVRYDEGKLSFWWYVDIRRTLIRLVFNAEIDGETLKGELREPNTVGQVTGTRIKVAHGAEAEDDAEEPGDDEPAAEPEPSGDAD